MIRCWFASRDGQGSAITKTGISRCLGSDFLIFATSYVRIISLGCVNKVTAAAKITAECLTGVV